MTTKEQIQSLKNDWHGNPCWDIEDTEGFEEHREELLEYRLKSKAEWLEHRERELKKQAEIMGIPDQPDLARYLLWLERKVQALQDELYLVKYPCG